MYACVFAVGVCVCVYVSVDGVIAHYLISHHIFLNIGNINYMLGGMNTNCRYHRVTAETD